MDKMRLVFTLSYNNPFTGKRMRAYRKDGIDGFIHECYTPMNAVNNILFLD